MPKSLSIEPEYATPVQKLDMEKIMTEAQACDVVFHGEGGGGMNLSKKPKGVSVGIIDEDEDQTSVEVYSKEEAA